MEARSMYAEGITYFQNISGNFEYQAVADNESTTTHPFEGFSETPPEYIFDRRGVQAFFLVFSTIVFAFCFFGNLAVILVVTLHWRMRSITNFCLANLAFADLCVGIFCVYQHIVTYLMESWIFGEFLCKMYHFINTLSTTASVLILVVICIERYFAIVHPMTCKQMLTINRLRTTIVLVWILSAAISFPRYYYFKLVYNPLPNDVYEVLCLPDRLKYDSKLFDMVNMLLLFLIPLAIISIVYTKIGIVLWTSSIARMSMNDFSDGSCNSIEQVGNMDNRITQLIDLSRLPLKARSSIKAKRKQRFLTSSLLQNQEKKAKELPGPSTANTNSTPLIDKAALESNLASSLKRYSMGRMMYTSAMKRTCGCYSRVHLERVKTSETARAKTIDCVHNTQCLIYNTQKSSSYDIISRSKLKSEACEYKEAYSYDRAKFLLRSPSPATIGRYRVRRYSQRTCFKRHGTGASLRPTIPNRKASFVVPLRQIKFKKKKSHNDNKRYCQHCFIIRRSYSFKCGHGRTKLGANRNNLRRLSAPLPEQKSIIAMTNSQATDIETMGIGRCNEKRIASKNLRPVPDAGGKKNSDEYTSNVCRSGRIRTSASVLARQRSKQYFFRASLKQQTKKLRQSGSNDGMAARLRSRKRLIKMLGIVVFVFALCHLPIHARKIWQYWSPHWAKYNAGSAFSTILTPITFLIMYANSAINPLLYAFFSTNFRKCFKDLLSCRIKIWRRS